MLDEQTHSNMMDALLGWCVVITELSSATPEWQPLQDAAATTIERYQREGIPLPEYEELATRLTTLHAAWLESLTTPKQRERFSAF